MPESRKAPGWHGHAAVRPSIWTHRSEKRAQRRLRLVAVIVGAVFFVPTLALEAAATSPVASVTIMHGLPGLTADIYVNGKLTLDGFKPLSTTPVLHLPGGAYTVAIRNVGQSASEKPLLTAAVKLEAGVDYTVIAHLDGSGTPMVSLFRNDLSRIPVGRSRLEVRNVANAPPLTVALDGRNRFADLENMSDRSAIISPGRHSVRVTSGQAVTVPTTSLSVAEGAGLVLYVVGSASDRSLDLMVQRVRASGAQPSGIPTGTGGLASHRSMPAWAVALMLIGGLIALWSRLSSIRRPTRQAG
jgi:hypothetical protein